MSKKEPLYCGPIVTFQPAIYCPNSKASFVFTLPSQLTSPYNHKEHVSLDKFSGNPGISLVLFITELSTIYLSFTR